MSNGKEPTLVKASDLAYSVDIVDMSKSFKRQSLTRAGYGTLKSSFFNFLFQRGNAPRTITKAIQDLTLRIPKGAAVGIIGKNGSGKSTLLKLITGIYRPDKGSISVNGRVAALIELGAGFHPDFTGRENLHLGGIMHGLTKKEVDERFAEIVEFAELQDVIDDPIRTYSSGMFMRLGFSLAVHTDPDVLIIDEVLSVGDASFVNKCKEKISALQRDGKTLILVTHDLDSVERWCNEALWIHEGKARDRGDPRRVIDHYRQFIEKEEEAALFESQQEEEASAANVPEGESAHQKERWGSREVEIVGAKLLDRNGEERLLAHPEDSLTIAIDYLVREKFEDVVFGISINRSDGLVVHGSNTEIERITIPELGKKGRVNYEISRLGLLDGQYSLDVAVHRKDGYPFDYHKGALSFAVRSNLSCIGVVLPTHRWEIRSER